MENGESQQPSGDVYTPYGHANHLSGAQLNALTFTKVEGVWIWTLTACKEWI